MSHPLSKNISNINDFQSHCSYFGIELNNNQLDLFKKYADFLINWNEKVNLVSRKMLEDPIKRDNFIYEKCFLDSLVFLPELKNQTSHIKDSISVLDIGSGAGFPAIPLTIIESNWNFTLYESIKKKSTFLLELTKELSLSNVKVVNDRVENNSKKHNLVTARAVTGLKQLIKYSSPALEYDGIMAFYKASDIAEELKDAKVLINSSKFKLEVLEKNINEVTRKLVILKR